MKVKELIHQLEQFPENWDVVVESRPEGREGCRAGVWRDPESWRGLYNQSVVLNLETNSQRPPTEPDPLPRPNRSK